MLFLSLYLCLNLPCSHEGIAGFFDGFHVSVCDVSGGTDEGEVHYFLFVVCCSLFLVSGYQ
jgi:hypothetical protein